MLKNDPLMIEPTPAAQTRVKADELARAVAAIEARRLQEAQGLGDTITVGDAIQELNLETTPEEILAEIEKQRSKPKQRRDARGFVLLAGVMLIVGIVQVQQTAMQQRQQDPPAAALVAAPNLLVQDNMGQGKILRTLSEVPDNRPVRCMFDDTANSGFTSFTSANDAWTLIKHNGQIYVRGWTEQMSVQARQQSASMDIYTDQPNGNGIPFVPVTLPLTGFLCLQPQSGNFEIVAKDVHLDRHAWEKW